MVRRKTNPFLLLPVVINFIIKRALSANQAPTYFHPIKGSCKDDSFPNLDENMMTHVKLYEEAATVVKCLAIKR